MNKENKSNAIIIISLIVLVIAVAIEACILLNVAPDYKFRYTTIGVAIPLPTLICISLSDFIRRYFLLLMLIILLVLAALIIMPLFGKNKSICERIYPVIACIVVLLIASSIFSLKVPLIKTRNVMMKHGNLTSKQADEKIEMLIKQRKDELIKRHEYMNR